MAVIKKYVLRLERTKHTTSSSTATIVHGRQTTILNGDDQSNDREEAERWSKPNEQHIWVWKTASNNFTKCACLIIFFFVFLIFFDYHIWSATTTLFLSFFFLNERRAVFSCYPWTNFVQTSFVRCEQKKKSASFFPMKKQVINMPWMIWLCAKS